ncbi:MAG: energy-coupled thiamine transporter ThiT [Clostridiales bacterium]|nr:energy-coupled thiamine transporter ThiT [Clostridiales bacterium]
MFEEFFGGPYGQALAAAAALICLLAIAGVFYRKKISTKVLTQTAACLAIATILSYVKFSFPQGGSITLCSMFFVSLVGFLFGPAAGIIGGAAYGLLQFAIEPAAYYPAQVFLDYPIAFGMLGLSGFFSKTKFVQTGFIVAALARGVVSTLSGILFFAEYAPEGQSVFAYSFIYNFGYIFPEVVLTTVILFIPSVKEAVLRVAGIERKLV